MLTADTLPNLITNIMLNKKHMASKLLILDSISMIIDGNKTSKEGIKGQKQVIFFLAQHLKENDFVFALCPEAISRRYWMSLN